jgi:hypothetical protein
VVALSRAFSRRGVAIDAWATGAIVDQRTLRSELDIREIALELRTRWKKGQRQHSRYSFCGNATSVRCHPQGRPTERSPHPLAGLRDETLVSAFIGGSKAVNGEWCQWTVMADKPKGPGA